MCRALGITRVIACSAAVPAWEVMYPAGVPASRNTKISKFQNLVREPHDRSCAEARVGPGGRDSRSVVEGALVVQWSASDTKVLRVTVYHRWCDINDPLLFLTPFVQASPHLDTLSLGHTLPARAGI